MVSLIEAGYTMYNMDAMDVCFVELEAFTAEVLRVADEEELRQFEAELAAKPETGDLIRRSLMLYTKAKHADVPPALLAR
jgi:hypothetical protein